MMEQLDSMIFIALISHQVYGLKSILPMGWLPLLATDSLLYLTATIPFLSGEDMTDRTESTIYGGLTLHVIRGIWSTV
jgi:hypothetical protein